jgi:hypothetical protein
MSPKSSGSKNKQSQNQHETGSKRSAYYLLHADFSLGLFFYPES